MRTTHTFVLRLLVNSAEPERSAGDKCIGNRSNPERRKK
jgi:hypothetical protein